MSRMPLTNARIRKVYDSPVGPKVAVQNLTIGIPPGECFGVLKIDGAYLAAACCFVFSFILPLLNNVFSRLLTLLFAAGLRS